MVYNDEEHNSFVYQTMLTCIGNKRKLVLNIRDIFDDIRKLLSKDKLNILDGFAGSSVVSRELSYIAKNIYINDMELYSYLMAYCYLVTPTKEQKEMIIFHISNMNYIAKNGPYYEGIICNTYSPKNNNNIQEGERCFYTRENALIIDTLRKYIEEKVDKDIEPYCLVPLLNKASINTNTSGVFKGFFKNDKIGCFGGKGKNALSRIMKNIQLDIPVWNNTSDFNAFPYNLEISELVDKLPNDIDVMYLDPPYNQHPYGSNYFMLNVIANNKVPDDISRISGIPTNWNRSNYNNKTAFEEMKNLIKKGLSKAKYLVISYNNEGIITEPDWKLLFKPYNVKKYEITYDTYKGSRNLTNRSNKVIEIMYRVSK